MARRPVEREEWVGDALLDPDAFLAALLCVWSRYVDSGLKPGSERWIFDDVTYGPKLWEDVRAAWAARVKTSGRLTDDPSCFPYSLSWVRRSFLFVRKFGDQKKRALCLALVVPFPVKAEQVDAEEPTPL